MLVLSTTKILFARLGFLDIFLIAVMALLCVACAYLNFHNRIYKKIINWIPCGAAVLAILAILAGNGFFKVRDCLKVTFPEGMSASQYEELMTDYHILKQDGLILTLIKEA